MEPTRKTTMYEAVDFSEIDVVAIEREARRLRAQAFGDALRATGRWIAQRVAALRSRGGQTA